MNFSNNYFLRLGLIFKNLLLNLLVFCFISLNVVAQEELIPAPAKPIATIPFTVLTGGIVVLRATLDNFKDSLNFVLDTGSGGISIDSVTCAYYNLKTEHSDRIVRELLK